MQELVAQDLPYAREFLPHAEGLERFKKKGLHEVPLHRAVHQADEKISIYKTGKFLDFCRGPHIPSTGRIKAFKLLNIAGAYWLGDERILNCSGFTARRFFPRKTSMPI